MDDNSETQVLSTHLFFHLALLGFALLLKLGTELALAYDPSSRTLSRSFRSRLIFEKVCIAA